MKNIRWIWVGCYFAVACLLVSCGSDGSLGSSGMTDWPFNGVGGRRQGSGAAGAESGASSGGSAGPTGTAGGTIGSGGAPGASAGATGTAGGATGTPGGATGTAGGNGTPAGTSKYHQLANWAGAATNNPNHHGRVYFLGNAHKDENGLECTSCHGKNYEGDAGPACATCHSEWRSSCSFCHGSSAMQVNPPRGIYDEASVATLAVGRHAAHLSAGTSHAAFACTTCHAVPAANDVDHTLGYQASSDLATPGHHGDVTLTNTPAGMTWSVGATSGSPVAARGTCVGGCHSDGRGGAPLKTPYWAGASWTSGCANCHASQPKTGHHSHALNEGGTCANCHAGSTPTAYAELTHLNGKTEYLGTVSGQAMTLKADSSCASGLRCNGTCHGNNEGHNNQCW
jgi:predicted CxxxxCH...CXXCH cytochrome family protein